MKRCFQKHVFMSEKYILISPGTYQLFFNNKKEKKQKQIEAYDGWASSARGKNKNVSNDTRVTVWPNSVQFNTALFCVWGCTSSFA
uniref:Uncharacterized protein n=1 Tax=Anguilla anguilla TaxID=7936 RepID=A0A0E9XT90_ANGAN